ncbi:sensor domain-containing protein [Kitasatospora sp. LaBMicrA B282]|uniref:sensor domain-containing protein n=1 Tax=Kitasatospora sp. LaBMicrA B282 TaxID=3420949 RepID=UPI003D0C876D
MSAPAEAPSRTGFPLDERVLGAGTTLRFVVLLTLFVAGTVMMTDDVTATLASGRRHGDLECALAAGADPGVGAYLGAPASTPAYRACVARYVPDLHWVAAVVLVTVVLAAAGLYRLLPRWRSGRPGVVAAARVHPELAVRLAELTAQTGLPAGLRIRFVVDVCAPGTGAMVYGTHRRPVVRLDGGLLVAVQRSADGRDRFDAVVLHELAHVANRDVGITYATVALWRVFLAVVLLPELAASGYAIVDQHFPAAWQMRVTPEANLVLVAVIGVLVYLVRSDILRVREVYADRTAVARGAVRERLLPARATEIGAGARGLRRVLAAAGRAWRTHPSWPQRAAALDRPQVLFRAAGLPLFLAGVAGQVVAQVAGRYLPGGWALTAGQLLAAALVVGVGGVAVWRSVLWALSEGREPGSGWGAGCVLGLGLAAGELLLFGIDAGRWWPPHPEAALVLVAACAAVLAWTAEFAELRITGYRGTRLQAAMVLTLVPAALALAFVQVYWNGNVLLEGIALGSNGMQDLTGYAAPHPPVLLHAYDLLLALPGLDGSARVLWWALPLLWLAPLVAWLVRSPAAAPGWLRATAPQARPLPDRRPPLRRAVGAGLAAGLLATAAVAGTVRATASVRRLHQDALTGSATLMWYVLAVVAAMALAAAVTAAGAGRQVLLQGLIAAGVAGSIGMAAVGAHALLDGCLGPADVLHHDCLVRPGADLAFAGAALQFVVTDGLPLAVLVTVLTRLLLATAPRRTGWRDEPAARLRHDRRPVPQLLAVGLLAVLTAGTVGAQTAAQSGPAGAAAGSGRPAGPLFQRAPSPQTVRAQVLAWEDLGGLDASKASLAAYVSVESAVHAMLDVPDDSPKWRTTMAPACAKAYAAADLADRTFQAPVAVGRPGWALFVSRLHLAATACHALEATKADPGALAAIDDLDDAVVAGNDVQVRAGQLLGAEVAPVPGIDETTALGDAQTDQTTGAEQMVTDYRTRTAGANATGLPAVDQIVTVQARVCRPATPPDATVTAGRSGWTLVLADGTTAPSTTSWAPGDFPQPLLPDGTGPALTAGQCRTGLLPFDLPAADTAYPVEVGNTDTGYYWHLPAPGGPGGATGPLTADQLKGALLTAADLPGYTDTDSDSDTLPTSVESTPDGPACQQLINGTEGAPAVYGTVAEVSRALMASTGDTAITLFLHSFPDPAAAQRSVEDIRAGVAGCRGYTVPDDGSSTGGETVRDITALPDGGDPGDPGGGSAPLAFSWTKKFTTTRPMYGTVSVAQFGSSVMIIQELRADKATAADGAAADRAFAAAVTAQAAALRSAQQG